MYALFRTRCGCEKITRIDGKPPPEYIDLPLFEIDPLNSTMPVSTRRFRLAGLIDGGMMGYVEEPPPASNPTYVFTGTPKTATEGSR